MPVYIYDADTQDFSTNGLCELEPVECTVEEVAGGLYELKIKHPITDNLKWALIQKQYIVKAPVPFRETPLIEASAKARPEREEHIIWEVDTTSSYVKLYSKASTGYSSYSSGATYSKGSKVNSGGKSYRWGADVSGNSAPPSWPWVRITTGSKQIKRLKDGDEVYYHEATDSTWSHITTKDGKTGYIQTSKIKYKRTEPYLSASPSYNTAVPPRQIREQAFRIYKVKVSDNGKMVEASAWHISYDQAGNLIKSYSPAKASPQAALLAMSNDLITEHDFSYYSNITGVLTADWAQKNGVEAICDPDNGAVAKLDAQLVRDNYDVFVLKNGARDRGVVIEYGKNLLSFESESNDDDVITRIMPIGTDKDGKVLLLPEVYVDSQYVGNYANPKAQKLDVSEAVEKEAKDGDPGMTKAQCYTKMREAAEAEFEKGSDLPTITINLDFVHLGDTAEYKQYKDLQQVYLYDTVTVKHKKLGVEYKTQVKGYVYDAIAKRYKGITFGKINDGADLGVIAGYQLSNGSVGGNKIAPGAVGSQNIRELSVLAAHILSLDAQSIIAGTITADKIQSHSITAEQIAAGTITAESAIIGDAAIGDANINNAGINYLKVKDMVAGTAIFEQGIGDELYISRLYVTAANIAHLEVGDLLFKDASGNFWRIGVDGEGNVVTTPVEVEYQNLSETALLNISEYTIVKSETEPSSPYVGQLWLVPSTGIISRCTAITPSVVWEAVKSSELHTSYINAVENGLKILSTGVIEVEAGGSINIKSMGSLKLEAGSSVEIETENFSVTDAAGDDPTFIVNTTDKIVKAQNLDAKAFLLNGNVSGANNVMLKTTTQTTINVSAGGSIQAAIDALPKYLTSNVTINVPAGTYTGDVKLNGFVGTGTITVSFASGVTIIGSLMVYRSMWASFVGDSASYANIIGGSVNSSVVYSYRSFLYARYLRVSGRVRTSASDGNTYGFYIAEGSSANLRDCIVERTITSAIQFATASIGQVDNCIGGAVGDYTTVANLGYGIRAYEGSHVGIVNNGPTGTTAATGTSRGTIVGTNTPTVSPGAPSAPTILSVDYVYDSAKYCDLPSGSNMNTPSSVWSSGYPRGGLWNAQSQVYSGMWLLKLSGGSVRNILTGLSGKTIQTANLTIHCDTCWAVTTTVDLFYMKVNTLPSGGDAPSSRLTDTGVNVTLTQGEDTVVNLKTWLQSMVTAGTAFYGFGLGVSGQYVKMDGTCSLDITYS